MKAYSSVKDRRARWPHKNFADVTPAALSKTQNEDLFTKMVLSAPTVDITNIDVSKAKPNVNMEVLEHGVHISCQNMFAVAETALTNRPKLENIVILEHAPRFDRKDVDPLGLKPKLATFANSTFYNLWLSSPFKDKIKIGKYNLDCSGDLMKTRYTSDKTQRFDGVHLYGMFGKRAFSRSLVRIIKNLVTSQKPQKESARQPTEINLDSQPRYHHSVKDNNRFSVFSSNSGNH